MSRHLAKLCILLMAFSVIFAGISTGYAAGKQYGNAHPVTQTGEHAHDGLSMASDHDHKPECVDGDKAGPAKQSPTNGCCHVASFPSVAPNDGLTLSRHVFTSVRLVMPDDETAASNNPEGQLRPPRLSA